MSGRRERPRQLFSFSSDAEHGRLEGCVSELL